MKTYKEPLFRVIDVDSEELLAGSPGGLNDGDGVGNQKPSGDNDGNLFSKSIGIRLEDDDEEEGL